MFFENTNSQFILGVSPASYDLPHPKLGTKEILLVRRVLLRAFEILRDRGYVFKTKTEDEITTAIQALVENDLRQGGQIGGFSRKTYDFVVRDGEFVDCSLEKIGKSPDLFFKPRHEERERRILSTHDGLFVECKPINKDRSAGSRYCDDGLIRFVNGDYAWTMREGFMLGYARDGRTIAKHLVPAMQERHDALNVVDLPEKPITRPDTSENAAEALRVSRHRREFDWPDGKGRATDILVYHSWHNCDDPVA